MHSKVVTIDCDYVFPQFAAAFLMSRGQEAAFIDNNTSYAVPKLMQALKKEGLSAEHVKYVIITHVHLDHAGGTSALMQACTQAKLLAHPKAARHMIDPERLINSAKKVYGEEAFRRLYGDIFPISENRVEALNDGETRDLGGKPLLFFHTRGHANHHICIFDALENRVFTGDSFGICYPQLQQRGLFIFPSTSPTDFEPKEAKLSLSRILETGANQAYLTHFGGIQNLQSCEAQLREDLDYSVELLEQAIQLPEPDSQSEVYCELKLREFWKKKLAARGISFSPSQWKLLEMDLKLNAQGIAFAAAKKRSLSIKPF